MYHFRIGDKILNELAMRDWRDNVATLEDKGTALGTLARYGSIATRANPGMRPIALQYLHQSIRALRDKVSRSEDVHDTVGCLHMNMLFNAEIINGNSSGALVHGKMLLHVLRQRWREQRLDYKMLLYQLHNDLQFTSTFLTRPIFDEGDWLPDVLKPLWDAAAPYMPVFPEEALDGAIQDEVVTYWFKKRRQMLKYEKLQNTASESLPPLPLVTTSVMAVSFLFYSRMINYFLDNEERLKGEGLNDEVESYLYGHQALALAACQLLKWTHYSPQIMGVPIYEDCQLLSALWHALEHCEAFAARGLGNEFLNARMWALYVGSLVERGTPFDQAPTNQQRFNQKLAELAWSIQIFTWDDIRPVLNGFLYEDITLSQGSIWFEGMMLDYRLTREHSNC
ncbi:hypothetical protein AYO21_11737 [Fonsecaea monophora]|uniref:Transcription factor domain-containing protein n=1 Tax=Fonsecaea monophora TaxID=254056 RepID=A0A177EQA8_9EURO|nr:hypothetical protein AYO21_11737 [Fonsecaea monophora]OAG34128.1 hypothetical protein AYO21_11737 [Fonsecaea monophora]